MKGKQKDPAGYATVRCMQAAEVMVSRGCGCSPGIVLLVAIVV